MRRVVYVIPYTSIIEQTADKFREILGPEAVLEHHSGVPVEIGENGELTSEAERLAWATETWDKPVIVPTAVRFFESLFSNKTSQCRKLHNLAQSVIVFDEAQMLPLSYLRPCVWAIAQLVQHYGASAVLCTATQPALDSLFREFAPDLIMKELCPMEAESWDAFRRVTFRQVGKLGSVPAPRRRWEFPSLYPHVPRPSAGGAGGGVLAAEKNASALSSGVYLPY